MRLLNVSIGKVQTVQIGADQIRTAHVKAPIAEPWNIGEDGVGGDERAVHPDKLYAYAASRAIAHRRCGKLVVATSDDPADDPVAKTAQAAGASVVRGPEHDVLARFGRVLELHPADVVVRLTADCPLVDAGIVRDALALHERSGADYTSNTLVRDRVQYGA